MSCKSLSLWVSRRTAFTWLKAAKLRQDGRLLKKWTKRGRGRPWSNAKKRSGIWNLHTKTQRNNDKTGQNGITSPYYNDFDVYGARPVKTVPGVIESSKPSSSSSTSTTFDGFSSSENEGGTNISFETADSLVPSSSKQPSPSPIRENGATGTREVLSCIHSSGLKLNPIKMRFWCRWNNLFGHLLTVDGVKPDPCNVSAICNMPAPRNKL